MALKTVKYSTCEELPCSSALPAEVVLCVNSEKVAGHTCPDGVNTEEWPYHYIDAILTDVTKNCCTGYYTYTFSFDDAQLREDTD